MVAQGERRGRAGGGDWQEDAQEARDIIRRGKPETVRPQDHETREQYEHRLDVLQATTEELAVLRGQQHAVAVVDHRPEVMPLRATCGHCTGVVVRSPTVQAGGDILVLSPWVHRTPTGCPDLVLKLDATAFPELRRDLEA